MSKTEHEKDYFHIRKINLSWIWYIFLYVICYYITLYNMVINPDVGLNYFPVYIIPMMLIGVILMLILPFIILYYIYKAKAHKK